jgi:uncharacterized damage-inducible protein DinB
MTPSLFPLMSQYNRWMNQQMYGAAQTLVPAELAKDRGAFFGSIMGTLNHICVADTIWLRRFATHPKGFASLADLSDLPAPNALKATIASDIAGLWVVRQKLDALIEAFVQELDAAALAHPLTYTNMAGQPQRKVFAALLQHCFNHQTHHRGQVSTLLFQAGVDVGVTDLVTLIPTEQA